MGFWFFFNLVIQSTHPFVSPLKFLISIKWWEKGSKRKRMKRRDVRERDRDIWSFSRNWQPRKKLLKLEFNFCVFLIRLLEICPFYYSHPKITLSSLLFLLFLFWWSFVTSFLYFLWISFIFFFWTFELEISLMSI